MTDKKTEILVVHREFWQSAASDIVELALLLLVVCLGVYLESSAMQWIAGILWVTGILAKAHRYNQKMTMSPQKAADELKRKYGVTAS